MQINTKFDTGQEVFIIVNSKIHEVEIETMTINIGYWDNDNLNNIDIKYSISNHPNGPKYSKIFNEREVFSTKQDLLDSL